MKIHGSISKHSKLKAKDFAETKENSAIKGGPTEVFSDLEGTGFEANLKAELKKSNTRKTGGIHEKCDGSPELSISDNNSLINELNQKKPANELLEYLSQSSESSAGDKATDQSQEANEKSGNVAAIDQINASLEGLKNEGLTNSVANATLLPEIKPKSSNDPINGGFEEFNDEGLNNSNGNAKPASRIKSVTSGNSKLEESEGLDVIGLDNAGRKSEPIAKENSKIPQIAVGLPSGIEPTLDQGRANINPESSPYVINVNSKAPAVPENAIAIEEPNPENKKSDLMDDSLNRLETSGIPFKGSADATAKESFSKGIQEKDGKAKNIIDHSQKRDKGGIPAVEEKPSKSNQTGVPVNKPENSFAPERIKSDASNNFTGKIGQIPSIVNASSDSKKEVLEGIERIDQTANNAQKAEESGSPIKELEKIGLGRAQNIKRVGGESGNKDENNRPAVAANISAQSDKSAEKSSQKKSSQENFDGGKNKSSEKKLVQTPIEAFSNKQNTSPVRFKSQNGNNLQQERSLSVSQINEELPRALASQADGSKSTMSFKLTPGSLGTLFVEVEISKGEVKAKFTAETKEAQAAIEANMPALKEKLEDAGLKLTHSECGLERRDDGSASPDRQKRQNAQKPQFGSEFTPEPDKEEKKAPRLRTRGGSIIEEFV